LDLDCADVLLRWRVSGAALVLGAVTRLIGRSSAATAVRKCIGGIRLGRHRHVLLIAIGRPERFLAMLRGVAVAFADEHRVLDIGYRSTLCGGGGGSRRCLQFAPRWPVRHSFIGYTAVLLSNTAIPVWQEARTSLPALFMGSAMAGAAQVLKLLPVKLPWQARSAVNTFGVVGSIAELAAVGWWSRMSGACRLSARRWMKELPGVLWKASRWLTIAGLGMSIFGRSRRAYWAGAILGTAGAIALRFAVFHAGKASARDPRATFELQRDGGRR